MARNAASGASARRTQDVTVAEAVRQTLIKLQTHPSPRVAGSVTTLVAPWSGITGTPTTLAGYGITSPLNVAQGGTGLASFTAGDTVYASGATTIAKLGIGTATQFMRVNAGATAPEWHTLTAGDIGGGAALTKTDDTNVTLTLGGTPAAALLAAVSVTVGWTGTLAAGRLNANVVQAVTNDTNVTGSIATQTVTLGWTGQLAVGRGGTGLSTFTAAGGMAYATASTTLAVLAIGAVNTVMLSTGSAPSWVAQSTLVAGSATKLQTARTIWGQSFDGTANVSGAFSGATTIASSGAATLDTGASGSSFGGAVNVAGAFTGGTGSGVAGAFGSLLGLGNSGSFPTLAGGNATLYGNTTLGAVLAGKGSTYDVYIGNSGGSAVMTVATGTVNAVFGGSVNTGALTATTAHFTALGTFDAGITVTTPVTNIGVAVAAAGNIAYMRLVGVGVGGEIAYRMTDGTNEWYAGLMGDVTASDGSYVLYRAGVQAKLSTAGLLTLTGGLTAGGNLIVGPNNTTSSLLLGPGPTANAGGFVQFNVSNSVTNWKISSNLINSGGLDFTPSTAGGGSTFTTPTMTLLGSDMYVARDINGGRNLALVGTITGATAVNINTSGAGTGELRVANATQYSETGGSTVGLIRLESTYAGVGSNIATFLATNAAADSQLNVFNVSQFVSGIQAKKYSTGAVQVLALNPDGGGVQLPLNAYITATGAIKVGFFSSTINSFNTGTSSFRVNDHTDTVNYFQITDAGASTFALSLGVSGLLTASDGLTVTTAGTQLGSPTGGDKGAGTLNMASDLFLSGVAGLHLDSAASVMSQMSTNLGTVTNGSDVALFVQSTSWIFIANPSDNAGAIFYVSASGTTPTLISDPGAIHSVTKGTASKVNVYWDAGTSGYRVQNNRGASRAFRVSAINCTTAL